MTSHLHELRRYSLLCALGITLTTTAAGASAAERGWHSGVAYDDTTVALVRSNASSGDIVESSENVTAYSLFGGVRITDHLAVDLRLSQADDLKWSEMFPELPDIGRAVTASTVFDATALHAYVSGILPFGRIWEAYAKGGFVYSRVSGEQLVTLAIGSTFSRAVSTSEVGFGFGLGVGATIAEAWHVSVGYESYDFDETVIGLAGDDGATIDSLEVGLTYRFGRRSP